MRAHDLLHGVDREVLGVVQIELLGVDLGAQVAQPLELLVGEDLGGLLAELETGAQAEQVGRDRTLGAPETEEERRLAGTDGLVQQLDGLPAVGEEAGVVDGDLSGSGQLEPVFGLGKR